MKKVLLVILDGFGEGKKYPGNAIALARTPVLDELKKTRPWATLKASGRAVGIPEGTQGGSEVGHFTIGAGRIVLQSIEEINESIKNGSFFEKPALLEACKRTGATRWRREAERGSGSASPSAFGESEAGQMRLSEGRAYKKTAALHLLGMISDQGVHSHIAHLFALLELAKREGVSTINIHAISDGRDVPEKSAEKFIHQIQEKIRELGLEKTARIATLVGRYFAMDRDENWERLRPAYDLYALGKGRAEEDPAAAVKNAYARGIESDYYIEPTVFGPSAAIQDSDSVVFWNFRSDRAREIAWCFTGEKNPVTGKSIGFMPEKIVRPYLVCLGPYSEKAPVVFPTPAVKNNLGEVLSKAGKKQLRMAETQKYAHVTYFMNSQIETPFPGEDRLLIESKKYHSYAEIPEMSAAEITDILVKKLAEKQYAFIAVNFANCDLVGHSGNLPATIRAVETIDECLGKIVPAAAEAGYVLLITGDHGNAEYKIYEDSGDECPSHTTNPVPFIVCGIENVVCGKNGGLQDIAPTVLQIMNISQPKEMTGKPLLQK